MSNSLPCMQIINEKLAMSGLHSLEIEIGCNNGIKYLSAYFGLTTCSYGLST